jgi:hypothetical protein
MLTRSEIFRDAASADGARAWTRMAIVIFL